MGFRATMYGSQKSHNPWLKCHENEEKIESDYVLRNDHIESKLFNQFQWSWYHSFSEDNALFWWKEKNATFSNIKGTKIERSAFSRTPGRGTHLKELGRKMPNWATYCPHNYWLKSAQLMLGNQFAMWLGKLIAHQLVTHQILPNSTIIA